MIESIKFKNISNTPGLKQNVFNNPKKAGQTDIGSTEVLSKNASEGLKLSFMGNIKIEAKHGEETTFHVNDFLDITDSVSLNDGKNQKFEFSKTDNGIQIKQWTKNDDGQEVEKQLFVAEFEDPAELPQITFKSGKYEPEITIHDDSLSGGRIQMFEGSEIVAEKFSLIMPKEEKADKKPVSFTGRTVITTLNKEQKTKAAVDKYFQSGLANKTTVGDYIDVVKDEKNDPTLVIPAGGFGTRFENMTEEDGENKPSFRLPTDDNYRIMAGSLNLGAMAGLIGDENDKLAYISQSTKEDSLQEGGNVTKVKEYKTDGGAIAEAIKKGEIPEDKDAIILNADIITNADITRTYAALKNLPDAALVIPYYPVDAKRAQSFGLMGLEKDDNGNMRIKTFIEKPPYTNVEPTEENFKPKDKYDTLEKAHKVWEDANEYAKMEDGKHYYGNPGVYVMSKEAVKVLKDMGIKDPGKTGLGAHVMPHIVKLCNEGKLLTEDGTPMKVYTVPLERKGGGQAYWDDIGNAKAYLDTIRKIAAETKKNELSPENYFYGLPNFVLSDFEKNTDLETGVVYMSDKSRSSVEGFKEQYGVSEFKGNIFAV